MTTLIILVILFAIAIIALIIISIKKFSDKTDYILIKLNSLNDKITDIDDKNKNITNALNEKITSILNKTIKVDSRFITLHETIKDNLNNIEIAIKALTNSISAIEEKLSTVPDSEDIIDSDELVNRIAEGLYDKMNDFRAKNSLPADKVEKPSPAKSKQRTKARKANNSYNSVQDAPQEKVNED